jgi:hypothetical protein
MACSPTLDWREFVAEGSDLTVTFPCRPDRHARAVVLAGTSVQMQMLVCSVDHVSYAITFALLNDPSRISPSLVDLRATAIGNVFGQEALVVPFEVKGMTPNDEAKRLSVRGRLPDGATVQEKAAFFVRGLRVYQATVLGPEPGKQAVETFFNGLKFQ